MITLFIYRS